MLKVSLCLWRGVCKYSEREAELLQTNFKLLINKLVFSI